MLPRPVAALERHQVMLYLAASALGILGGVLFPGARLLEPAITPLLALLLLLTFLGVPFTRIAGQVRNLRFLSVLLGVNFLVVPLLVYVLTRPLSDDPTLIIAVALVLLAPCIDYVVVFTGVAGGDRLGLLAATPLLMVLQMALLPVYLPLMTGDPQLLALDPQPFLSALLFLIILPLGAALGIQLWGRSSARITVIADRGSWLMVPVMMLVLAVVLATFSGEIREHLGDLLRVIPIFLLFIVVIVPVAVFLGRGVRLEIPAMTAIAMSAATRNSLVVLPLALALPGGNAPLIVTAQTLVELLAMLALIRVLPALLRRFPPRARPLPSAGAG